MIAPETFSRSVLALACWRAAKSEPHQIMLSICMVFKNRAEYAKTDLYEEATRWLADNPGEFPDPRDPQFQSLLSKLEGVATGFVPDKTDGALWFAPKSSEAKIAGQITTTMGQTVFIK